MSSCASPVMPLRVHARAQLDFDFAHALFRALEAHGAAQLLGLAAGEAGRDHGHAQQLLLEQRHAQRALQHRLERGMQAIRRLRAPAAGSDTGCTILPTIGPGRMMATCTTMS